MKGISNYYRCLAGAVLLGLAATASALPLNGVLLGSGAPPATIGGLAVTPIGADASPIDSAVTSDGAVGFNQAVIHEQVGNGWATWSHGYAGDVYHTADSVNPTTLTLTLASPLNAFYFYVEPVNFANFTFTATSQDGTTLTQVVNGNGGAVGFGFYASGFDFISSITITESDADGFAVGEFGLGGPPATQTVPDAGGTLLYACLGLLGLCGCGYSFRRQARAAAARV